MGNSSSKKDKKAVEKAHAAAQKSNAGASSAAASSPAAAEPNIQPRISLVDVDEPPVENNASKESEYQPPETISAVPTQEAAISFWNRDKTYRPQRVIPESTGQAGQRIMNTVNATMKATLGGGDLEAAVKCPPGEDRNEWLAVNTVQFFNAASLVYGTIQSYCTHSTCPIMSAGRAEYLWRDDNLYPKPTRLPAPVYIDLAMSAIDAQITDPEIFPVDENARFPRNFMAIEKGIFKRLFRLYAHIYCAHHDKIRAIGASAHLNTTFKHLVCFILEFGLVEKAEMQPLEKLIARITAQNEAARDAHNH